jgi:hypothetical protein
MEIDYLFGSRVRAGALEALALTSKPLSAYHVAKLIGAEPIQVSSILKALEPDLVIRREGGWVLSNDSLRRFLRDDQARRESERRTEKDDLLTRLKFRPSARHGRR